MSGLTVYSIEAPGRENVVARRLAADGKVKVVSVPPAATDLATFVTCLDAYVQSDSGDPMLYLTSTMLTPLPSGEALARVVRQICQREFTVCYLHRWGDRCDFLRDPSPLTGDWAGYSVARTVAAHGDQALLVSPTGARLIINDERLRTHLKLKLVTPFHERTHNDLSSKTWSQWFSPTPVTLDDYLAHIAPETKLLAVTPCLFQWDTLHCSFHFDDYAKTHECAPVVIERTSRAHLANEAFRAGLETCVKADFKGVFLAEAVILVLLLLIAGVWIYNVYGRRSKI